MKMLAVSPLFIVALCIMQWGVSAVPIPEPELDLDRRDVLDTCQGEWTQFESYCYLVSAEIHPHSVAKQWCTERQGYLVKINSAEENEFVLQLVRQKAPSLKQVWIGLEWIGKNFYWGDLSYPVYHNWAPNEPNGNAREPCGMMFVGGYAGELPYKSSGYWNDFLCDVQQNWHNGLVCKRLRPLRAS
ncbi:snaclec coagulation factor IX-binding protein subunit A-like [Oculina patagonica]